MRIRVLDVDVASPLSDLTGLSGYGAVRVLVRLHGAPVGHVQIPVRNGRCAATTLRAVIAHELAEPITRHLLRDALAAAVPTRLHIVDVASATHPVHVGPWPLVSVVVCTRDRTENLPLCLDALERIDYPNIERIVVDNAPSSAATEQLLRNRYPTIRYVRESRPGLDWARNRGIVEARGEIVAFTDDDAVVDPGWVRAIATGFAESPGVMAVTGLVVPYELESEAQQLFEQYGGFGRGYERGWYSVSADPDGEAVAYRGTGHFGTGANMAFRRELFDEIGPFDPALDVGTVTNGGGDLEMFFRVLKEGHGLLYEAAAIVRHRHRRTYRDLKIQLTNNGIGFYSHLMRSAIAYPDERLAFLGLGLWWFWLWSLKRLGRSLLGRERLPRDLIVAELRGSLIGLSRYHRARRAAAQITARYGPLSIGGPRAAQTPPRRAAPQGTVIRTVDVADGLSALTDVQESSRVAVRVLRGGKLLGTVTITNNGWPIAVARLRHAIVATLGTMLLDRHTVSSPVQLAARVLGAPTDVGENAPPARDDWRLREDVPVSVVVATRDRPAELRRCLVALTTQVTDRRLELIVVDNASSTDGTRRIVDEFPGVRYLHEPRRGLSYARNAGILASSGKIIVMTDDDTSAPPDWIERLLVPFAAGEVMAVTGNVLPMTLNTRAQRLFEAYGGLGRGFERFVVDGRWFRSQTWRSVPTWRLGATANAAFRATIFRDPRIGLLREELGVGSATGCSEDTYLFYRLLKAGGTLVYEPAAYVLHDHRADMRALRAQLYAYSKGHVAYHLLVLLEDRDPRALSRLLVDLPIWRIRQTGRWVRRRLRGRADYPLSLIVAETAGNIAGPWALLRARRRVRRVGRSDNGKGTLHALSHEGRRA